MYNFEHQSAVVSRDRESLRERWYASGYYTRETVGDALLRAIEEKPETNFQFHTESGIRTVSTATIVREGLAVSGELQRQGLRPGDVVAVQLPNWYDTAVIYVAIFMAGGIVLPIVHSYGPAEIGFILRQSRARWLFMPDRWRNIDYIDRYERIGHLPDLKRLVVLGTRLPHASAIRWTTLLEAEHKAVTRPEQSADDVCLLLYTSGTTSEPKGVRHTHNTLCSEWKIPFFSNDGLFLNPFPAGHIAGFNYLLRPIICGVPMVFLDRWDAQLAARLIDEMKVRQTGGTPYFALTLLDAARKDGRDLSSLEFYGIGGTVVTAEQVRFLEEKLCPAGRTYGMTEHSTVTQSNQRMSFEQRAYTDGKVQPGTEVLIVDDKDEELPIGMEGNILVRGPELFVGYTDPALDVAAFAPGGWFRTGDVGAVDPQGFLTITDRKKDIVIRGGENISSSEVEAVVAQHPAVNEVAVVAKPDPYYGEKVCAFIILKPGASLSPDDLISHCQRSGLARLKTPEHLRFVDEMPRTAAGKVRKAELRKLLSEER